jgi:hypothetical protein
MDIMGTYIVKEVGYFDEPCAKCGRPAMILGSGDFFKKRGVEHKPLCADCEEQMFGDAVRELLESSGSNIQSPTLEQQ